MFWPIAEQVLLRRMPMEVKTKIKAPVISFPNVLAKVAQSSNLWENILIELIELPIKVFATVASPKVASYDPIRVEHWHNIKHKHTPQIQRVFTINKKFSKKTFQYVGWIWLAWVYSSCEKDCFFLIYLVICLRNNWLGIRVCDREQGQIDTSQRLAQSFGFDDRWVLILNFLNKLL